MGEGLVALIVAEREANGPFVDFYDFCDRVDTTVLNKRTIESLIKAGGFDCPRPHPQGPARLFEQIIDETVARRRKEAEGQFDLFSMADEGQEPGAVSANAATSSPSERVRQAPAPRLREGDARPLRVATTR